MVTVGNSFPWAIVGTSRWEGDHLVTQSEFTQNGTTVHGRSAYSDIKDRSTRIEEFLQLDDSPFELLWNVNRVKK